MIHNYSTDGGGHSKGHELRAMVDFTDAQLNEAFSAIYGNFLTPREMELVIAGKDMWMGKQEVYDRIKYMKKNDSEGLEEYVEDLKDKRGK